RARRTGRRQRSGTGHRQRFCGSPRRPDFRRQPSRRRRHFFNVSAAKGTTTSGRLLMTTEETRPAISVLVIDDEPQIRRLLRVTLEAHGYAVTDAATGKEGIVQAAQARPEIIVLDLGLPDL